MLKRIFFFLILTIFTSCVSQKEITYFQPKDVSNDIQKIDIKERFIVKLQPGDILNIMVNSISPEANTMFNVFPVQTGQINVTGTATTPPIGFLVDSDGFIALPLVGKILISGLSSKEASDLISKKLDQYLVQPTVSVRVVNYKISVLGEVNRPSLYTINNEVVTLPEALSLAGDLTIFGKRQNILVIREVEGKKEFSRVDLTKRDFFNSPYYYLRPNDIVYVEPAKGRITNTSRSVQLAPVFISALTFLTLVAVNFINLTK